MWSEQADSFETLTQLCFRQQGIEKSDSPGFSTQGTISKTHEGFLRIQH